MPTSIFLARLMGPIGIAVGLGVLLNAAVFRKLAREVVDSTALVYLSGMLTMTAGMAIVLTHNVWVADWRAIITVLGWLMVVGGVIRIVFPQWAEGFGRWMLGREKVAFTFSALVWLVLGALLCYFGYFH